MNIGFQIDAIEKLNFKTDSSLPIILESQKRKNKNFYFLPSSLTYKNNYLYAQAREIFFKNEKLENVMIGNEKQVRINQFHYVFITYYWELFIYTIPLLIPQMPRNITI